LVFITRAALAQEGEVGALASRLSSSSPPPRSAPHSRLSSPTTSVY